MAHVPTEEDLTTAILTELYGTDALTHAVLRHHASGQGGDLLDVVAGARRRVVEDHLLGDPTAQGEGQLVEDLVAGRGVLVVQRHDHGVTKSPTAGQDRDLRDRVRVEHGRRNDRVSALVVGGDLLLFGTHDPGALLRAGDDTVDRLVQSFVVDELVVASRSEQRRLVQDVGQVGTGETRRPSGHRKQVDASGQRLALAMHLQDAVASDHVGCIDRDLAVEAARAQEGGVKDVRSVGGSDQDDVGLDVEAVHLDEELVERLLTLIVATAEAGATVAADGIDLVDEHDRGGVGLGLFEQVAYPGGTDADEHLDEVRTGDRVERHGSLARDGARQQGLAGAGRAVEQDALGDLGTHGEELGRLGEELLDLEQLLDGLIHASDVGERDFGGVLVGELGLALAELHDLGTATLHPTHQEPEQTKDDDQRDCLLYTSPSPRDRTRSRMPSSA